MPIVHEPCSRCGGQADVGIAQAIWGSGLAWSLSTRCVCGHMLEVDVEGSPPKEYRDLILAEQGTWEVVVLNASDRLRVSLVAREALGLSAAEAFRFGSTVPGAVYSGTPCEARWFRQRLEGRGVTCESRRVA